MASWLEAALDYIPLWLEHQRRQTELPGCVLAVAERGVVRFERAFGVADLGTGEALTPRHRFRVASHSKSFTAAGVLKLREQGKLRLDDPVGWHVKDLHPDVAAATLNQLLSHSAGLIRDGSDAGQWIDRRPFLNAAELREDLAGGLTIPAATRLKYSNHGYGLLGLVIEAVTGESYGSWIRREIVAAAGLAETEPDMPAGGAAPFTPGHSGKLPLGRRIVIPGENSTNVLAAATGFVSTAADLVRFFAQLDPEAETSILTPTSRREMIRSQWDETHSALKRRYGLGTISGEIGDWRWFGHSGGFQGYITRTLTLPAQGLTVSILTNAVDGPAQGLGDGVVRILQAFAKHGAPSDKTADWTGRWWSLWTSCDLVALGDKVVTAVPGQMNPFQDASEIEVTGPDTGRIALAGSFGHHGEPVRRTRAADGSVSALHLGGGIYLPEAVLAAELAQRYG